MTLADDLVEAIEENYGVEEIEKLLNEGANPNEPNNLKSYPLTAAVGAGNYDVVKLLLQRGADVNIRDRMFYDATALFIEGDLTNDDDNDTFRMLIDAGADLSLLYDRYRDQITVLMLACLNGHVNRVKMLLEAGADVNQKSDKGTTALMIAARAGQRDIVTVLLHNGADPTIVNNAGESAEPLIEALFANEPSDTDDEPESENVLEQNIVNEDDEEPEREVVIHDWAPKIKLSGNKAIHSVAFSPEGTEIAFSGDESDINVIDLERMRTITAGQKEVTYSRDGNWIGIVSELRGAKLTSRNRPFERQLLDKNDNTKYTCIDFSSDSKHVVTGSTSGVDLWDVKTGSLLRTFNGHKQDKSTIISVKFSPDNQHFASLADNIMVWSVTGGLVNMMRKNDDDEINAMTYNPDGKSIVFVTASEVFVWTLKTNNMQVFNSDEEPILSMAFSPDGKYIMTGSIENDDEEATIQLWDAQTYTKLGLFKSFLHEVNSIAFSPDAKTFLLGGIGDKINLVLGEISALLKHVPVTFLKELEKITLKRANVTLSGEPDIFDTFMAETYPLQQYKRENPNGVVFLTNQKNGFGYDRDQLREMTIGAKDYYFKCLKLNEALVVALSNVEGETPFLLLRSAGTFYVPAGQLQAALDSNDSIFILREYDTLPYTASIGVIETAPPQRNYRGEQINVVSRDHCQAGSNKKAYEIIAVANA